VYILIMRGVGLSILLLWSASTLAGECGEAGAKHWSTVVKLAAGPVTLHWSGLEDAHQVVCSLSFRNAHDQMQTLQVWGEPEPNERENLIAFASCAEDGCDNTIVVADMIRGVVLKGALPVSLHHMYLSLQWHTHGRSLLVDVEGITGETWRRFTCSVADAVFCAARL
jgi:hypothetical protein